MTDFNPWGEPCLAALRALAEARLEPAQLGAWQRRDDYKGVPTVALQRGPLLLTVSPLQEAPDAPVRFRASLSRKRTSYLVRGRDLDAVDDLLGLQRDRAAWLRTTLLVVARTWIAAPGGARKPDLPPERPVVIGCPHG